MYILLFSLGCVGSASMGFLHKCLKTSLTKYLFFLYLALLVSTIRVLLDLYLSILGYSTLVPPNIQIAVGVLIGSAVYYLLYKVLAQLKNISPAAAFISTISIYILQLVRTGIYYLTGDTLTLIIYPIMIILISLYLFFVGFSFIRGIDNNFNRAVQKLLQTIGIVMMIFSPISASVYLTIHFLGRGGNNLLSLDFLLLAIMSFVSVSVVLYYLTRIGTIPKKTTADQQFLDNYNLSPRETEVLELILKGYSNKKIGEKLFISFTTARTHVSHIFEKTSVSSRMELVSKVMNF